MLNALFPKPRDATESCASFLMVEGTGCNELPFTSEEMTRHAIPLDLLKLPQCGGALNLSVCLSPAFRADTFHQGFQHTCCFLLISLINTLEN